jgi:hypothetical protein
MTSFPARRDHFSSGPAGASAPLCTPQSPVPSQSPRPNARRESGYALLMVFLLAAMIAVALCSELPRAAFEAQRAKEQLLIERGEQYKRAIQLFVRKVGRYPATIEELESLNNVRFLRKRYVDPMTGKDKWRLIHVNGGVLTDSIIPKNKPDQGQQQQANTNTFIGEGPVTGATNDPNQQQINPALRRRASDDRPVAVQEAPDPPDPADADQENPATDDSDNSNTNPTTAAAGAPMAANTPGMPNQRTPDTPPGPFPQPGMSPGQPSYNSATSNQPNGTAGAPTNPNPGLGGSGGSPSSAGQNGDQSSGSSVYVAPFLGQSSSPNGGQSSGSSVYVAPFLGQTSSLDTSLPAGATGLPGHGDVLGGRDIRNLRVIAQNQAASGSGQSGFGGDATSPPDGLPGMEGTQVGGGIAGVASEFAGSAIAVYNQRNKYNEWEFVYDQSKDRGLAGVPHNGGVPGTTAQSMGSMPGQQPGMGGPAGSSGFGQPAQQPQLQSQQPPN